MNRVSFIVLYLFCVRVLCAQTSLVLPYDATALTDEQKASNPERLAYPTELKETIKNEVSFECNTEITDLGPFSVSATTKVMFSPGNLQFNAMKGTHQCAGGTTEKGTWRFAKHQWDFVGDAESGTVYEGGTKCNNAKINATYNGWIDLFGWGTSGWNSGAVAYQPWSTNTAFSDYTPGGDANNNLTGVYARSDWGVYNAIRNGAATDPPGTWRTLTEGEWEYLFHGRKNAEKLFGLGTVNGVQGTILLPDDWATPSGVTFTPSTEKGLVWDGSSYYNSNSDNYSHNSYMASEWDKMESAGAVFLPAAGERAGTDMYHVGSNGFYWSATPDNTTIHAYHLGFHSFVLYPQFIINRSFGHSVRLVR